MARFADRQIREAAAALASPAEAEAAGVAAAMTCALAASLVELSAGLTAKRLAEDTEHLDAGGAAAMRALAGRAAELRERLIEAADEDVEAYAEVVRAGAPARDAALARAADPPLAISEYAAEVTEAAAETAARAGAWAFGADAVVAGELSAAAARGGATLVAANLGAASDDPRAARARDAADRAARAIGEAGNPTRG